MSRLPLLVVVLLGVGLLAPSYAAADDSSDFRAVAADYIPDRDVTSCAFPRSQLEGARREAVRGNDGYGSFNDFIAEVDTEIARLGSGFCSGQQPPPAGGKVQPVFTARLLAARQKGKRVIVKVSLRLLKTQGRPCQGQAVVGAKVGGRSARRVFQLKGRCTRTVVFRFRVGQLNQKVRSRKRRLLVRTTALYRGSPELELDRAPPALKRVVR